MWHRLQFVQTIRSTQIHIHSIYAYNLKYKSYIQFGKNNISINGERKFSKINWFFPHLYYWQIIDMAKDTFVAATKERSKYLEIIQAHATHTYYKLISGYVDSIVWEMTTTTTTAKSPSNAMYDALSLSVSRFVNAVMIISTWLTCLLYSFSVWWCDCLFDIKKKRINRIFYIQIL